MLAPLIERNDSMYVDARESWMDPIKAYLKNESFTKDMKKAKKN